MQNNIQLLSSSEFVIRFVWIDDWEGRGLASKFCNILPPSVAVSSLSLHWFSCQFPSPGARPGCHAPFTAVRISAQKNRKIHKIIPYLTKTLSITQRSGMKRCVPRRKLYKIDFLCVWGWGKLVEFPLFLSKCVFSFVIFCFARLGLVPASARGRGSVQAGLQPMQKTFNQLKH